MAKYYFGSEKEAVEKYAGKFTRRTATDSLFNLKLNFASDLCLAQQCSIKRPSDCLLDVMQYISILQVYSSLKIKATEIKNNMYGIKTD